MLTIFLNTNTFQILFSIALAFIAGLFIGGVWAAGFVVHQLYRDGYLHLVPAPKA